jgi:hypothetical protein
VKNRLRGLGVLGVLVGIILSRMLGIYYGDNARIAIMALGIVLLIIIVGILIIKKQTIAGVVFFSMTIPIIIIALGMCENNLYLVLGGLILFCIVLVIVIKYLNSIKK